MPSRPLRTTLLGHRGAALERLFVDLLGELGYAAELVAATANPSLVFVMVTPEEAVQAVDAAKEHDAAVIALFALTNDRAARRALERGAAACYALDTPLDRLRDAMEWALTMRSGGKRTRFSLGPRARLQIAVAREAAAALPTPPYWLHDDTFHRVESAIRVDLATGEPTDPFRLGVHARLEITLMRLSPSAIAALEAAIDEDLRELAFSWSSAARSLAGA
jgi:hypothetical protein